MDDFGLLTRLLNAPGVPGRERRVAALVCEVIERHDLADEVTIDALGSVHAVRRARPSQSASAPARRVMLAAHLDQIGFLVSHVGAEGLLRLHPVGAFDPRSLFTRRVSVVPSDGEPLCGVVTFPGRPLHTADPAELTKTPALEEAYVDLGMSGDAVRARVKPGDMVLFEPQVRDLGDAIMAPGLDDRAGCWALLTALKDLNSHNVDIHAVFTSQEEVGSRGATPAAFSVAPDVGIVCDTTVCADTPGVEPHHHVTQFAAGVALQVADSSTLSDEGLIQSFEAVAAKRGIPCQRALMLGGGQDGARIQLTHIGVPTLVLSLPVKYLHTETEMAHKRDLVSYRQLLGAWLETDS